MEDNITVLVDAKLEYTKQLTNILIPFIFEGIKSVYKSTVSICKINQDNKILMRFQEQLSQIPKWNQEIIDEEYQRIIESSKCDWLDDLVTAVFLSHTKILTAIKSGNKPNKINLKIPKIDHFIHKCYIESAREFWKNPYIFSDQVSQSEYQRNIGDGHKIIGACIEETIRKLLPVKNILKEYLGQDESDDNSLLPENYKDNLKKLVQKEIEICQGTNQVDENKIMENLEKLTDLEEVNIGVDKSLKKDPTEVESLPTNLELEETSNNLVIDELSPVEESNKMEDITLEKTPEKLEPTSEENKVSKTPEETNTFTNLETEKIDLNIESLEPQLLESLDLETENELDEVQLEPESLETKLESVALETKLEPETLDSEVKLESVTLETKLEPVPLETKLEPEALNSEVKLESVPLETKLEPEALNSEVKLESVPLETKLEPETLNSEVKLEPEPLAEVSLDSNNSIQKEELPKTSSDVKLVEIKTQEENQLMDIPEENKLEQQDIQQVKEIIKDELYDRNLPDTSTEYESDATIENMKFKKLDLDTLNIETLESDGEFSNLDLDDSNIKSEDLEIEPFRENTSDKMMAQPETKTIIIDKDKITPMNKISRNKKKNFKFFD